MQKMALFYAFQQLFTIISSRVYKEEFVDKMASKQMIEKHPINLTSY